MHRNRLQHFFMSKEKVQFHKLPLKMHLKLVLRRNYELIGKTWAWLTGATLHLLKKWNKDSVFEENQKWFTKYLIQIFIAFMKASHTKPHNMHSSKATQTPKTTQYAFRRMFHTIEWKDSIFLNYKTENKQLFNSRQFISET